MNSTERFNALPYSKRVERVSRTFFVLLVAAILCRVLEWEGLGDFFVLASMAYGMLTIVILCGGKAGGPARKPVEGGKPHVDEDMWDTTFDCTRPFHEKTRYYKID